MHSKPVHEHLPQLYPFLAHLLIIQDPVGTYNVEVLYFSLDQQVTALSIDPKFVVLHNNLLVVCFGKLLFKSKWVKSERIMERHFILDKAMFVSFVVVIMNWPRHFLRIYSHSHGGNTIK